MNARLTSTTIRTAARATIHTAARATIHTAARATVAALATVGAVTTLAGTATAAATPHVIDTDWVRVSAASVGQVYGPSGEVLRSGSVQARLVGKVARYSGGPGCVLARVIYTYADGRTETKDSPRACLDGLAVRDVDLSSSTSKDLVEYAVQLHGATDATAPSYIVAGSTYFVGDAPDSLGTKERLDHDTVNAVREGATVFRGSSDYSVTKSDVYTVSIWSVRSHVVGDLTWSDKLVGSHAYVRITWTYADGSTGTATSSRVYRDGPPVHVDTMSDKFKDVRAVRVVVYTDSVRTFGGAAAPDTKFGDYGSI